jgi:hypothetical protein
MKPVGALNRPVRPRPAIRPPPAASVSSTDLSANSRYISVTQAN